MYIKNELFDSISLLIDRTIEELHNSKREDKDKFIEFFNCIKYNKANTFEEDLQRILFFNQLFWQTGHGLNCFGRLDYILNDFYNNDSISKDEALKLIKDFLKAANSYFILKALHF